MTELGTGIIAPETHAALAMLCALLAGWMRGTDVPAWVSMAVPGGIAAAVAVLVGATDGVSGVAGVVQGAIVSAVGVTVAGRAAHLAVQDRRSVEG